MKRFGIIALLLACGSGCGSVIASTGATIRGTGSVKEVKIYPQGAYLTLSVPVELRGGAEEEIAFPDLWYADPTTVELKLVRGAKEGVTYVMESQQALRGEDVELQQANLRRRDTLAGRQTRLEADSMVLAREIEFLAANAKLETNSVSQLSATDAWMRERYTKVYEAQRLNREARAALDREIGENERQIRQIERQAKARHVTCVRARANAPRAQRAVFELSYFSNSARWRPVYFFRFEPGGTTAELDYRATVWQWSRLDWERVPTWLSYGTPTRSLNRAKLNKWSLSYDRPMWRSRVVSAEASAMKFGGTYTGEEEPTILDPNLAFDGSELTSVEVSENDISYRLGRPLTLASSTDRKQIQQTVEVRRDTIPVLYEYETTPKISRDVLLLARIPDWQRLNLTDGRMNIFCDGRILGQSELSVRSTRDTLEMPVMLEPQVVVDRKEVGDYQERPFGSKMERSQSYEIRIKNNKAFPVNLTVRDQYPVSTNDDIEVTLTEQAEAEVDPTEGILTWRIVLAPGEERTLSFGYTIRYPKGGSIRF